MNIFVRHEVIFNCELFKYKLLNQIGIGDTASVYECDYDGIIAAVKLIPLNIETSTTYCKLTDEILDECIITSTKSFLEEVSFSQKFSELQISPRIFETGFFTAENNYQGKINIGYIIQEKFDMTLQYFVDNHKNLNELEHILFDVLGGL